MRYARLPKGVNIFPEKILLFDYHRTKVRKKVKRTKKYVNVVHCYAKQNNKLSSLIYLQLVYHTKSKMYKILQQDYYQSISSSLKSKFYTGTDENHNHQVQKLQNYSWEINRNRYLAKNFENDIFCQNQCDVIRQLVTWLHFIRLNCIRRFWAGSR